MAPQIKLSEAAVEVEPKNIEEGQPGQSSSSTASTSAPSSPEESIASFSPIPSPKSSSRTKTISSLLSRRGILQSSMSSPALLTTEDVELSDEPKSPTLEYLDKKVEPLCDPVKMAQDKVHGKWHRSSQQRAVGKWLDKLMMPHLIPIWMIIAVVVEAGAIYGGMQIGGVVSASFSR